MLTFYRGKVCYFSALSAEKFLTSGQVVVKHEGLEAGCMGSNPDSDDP